MKTLLLSLFTLMWASPMQAEIASETTDALVERVREVLPEGWQVSYEKKYTFLKITRTNKALARSAFPNQQIPQKTKMDSFSLAFRVIPQITPEEYRRLSEENKKTRQEIEHLYEVIKGRGVGIHQKSNSFLPKKEEDKKLVDQYDKLRKSLHDLPDFYFRHISLNWIYGSADFPMIRMKDENIQNECNEVREKVVKLFEQYESGQP